MPLPPAHNCNTAERTVVIRSEQGLHMRPAMQFVDRANTFESQITVSKNEQLTVDGKSIMKLTTLVAVQGTELTIRAVGSDAAEAVETLAGILENDTTDNAE